MESMKLERWRSTRTRVKTEELADGPRCGSHSIITMNASCMGGFSHFNTVWATVVSSLNELRSELLSSLRPTSVQMHNSQMPLPRPFDWITPHGQR